MMAHVMLVLLNLCKHIKDYCGDHAESQMLLTDIEKRWKTEENPLFFLAFALHPLYRGSAHAMLKASTGGNWQDDRNPFTVARLAAAAKFYYGKHGLHIHLGDSNAAHKEEENKLKKAVEKWISGKVTTGGHVTCFTPGENEVEWWGENLDENPFLATFAMWILDACIQAASCERLFKDFAQFHTKVRNRMKTATTHDSTVVKHDM